MSDRLQDPSLVDKPVRPDAYQELLDLMEQAGEGLVIALGQADPQVPVWTWANDKSVRFILRRQAHEALIHRVDAELTVDPGRLIDTDEDLAFDGIDEMVNFFVAGDLPEWSTFTPDGATIKLETGDGAGKWTLAFGRFTGTSPVTGNAHDLDATQQASGHTENVVRGNASGLDLWLWGRADASGLTIEGDAELPARLRALAAEGTQ